MPTGPAPTTITVPAWPGSTLSPGGRVLGLGGGALRSGGEVPSRDAGRCELGFGGASPVDILVGTPAQVNPKRGEVRDASRDAALPAERGESVCQERTHCYRRGLSLEVQAPASGTRAHARHHL